ncbi:MAG: FGGY family carbohydrate kinase [Patescibacteria group bacterium]|nr:FGGY family carbohydrate kinase [Patescibacteria group bacterium]
MSLLGIDVGTTGCKASVFSETGIPVTQAYREYNLLRPHPGWAEFDSREVWEKIKEIIKTVVPQTAADPITALSVSSCGEAMTPVSKNREILGNAILGFDERGEEYVARFITTVGEKETFMINGNSPNHSFTAPKLIWYRENKNDVYEKADYFLGWPDLIFFFLGIEPVTDYALANRTMLFDVNKEMWSDELINAAGISKAKLPRVVPPGTDVGTISGTIADELGLPRNVRCVTGSHDQCCTALGAGVVKSGQAAYGIGTFICITPVFSGIPDKEILYRNHLNFEHHVIPGKYVLFLSNMTGGAVLKWFRDEFAVLEKKIAQESQTDVYAELVRHISDLPSNIYVLPYFSPTGSPYFDARTPGAVIGLRFDTTRWEILKALLEGATYYFAEGVQALKDLVTIDEYRPTGGGAKSDAWLQMKADIMGKSFARPKIIEASSLGAVMLAGTATGIYSSFHQATEQLVKIDRIFEPDAKKHTIYQEKLEKYKLIRSSLVDLAKKIF